MTTQNFIPKSELFDWLRQSVRRRENVALKIITDPQRDRITLRLSDGRLVYVHCEHHGPLDALILLAECDQVRFTFASAPQSKRRELMSSDAFLKWIDTAGAETADMRDTGAGSSPGGSDDARWTGTLRGGSVKKRSAGVVAAVVAVVAVIGLIVAASVLDGVSGETRPASTADRTSTKIGEAGAEFVPASIVDSTTWKAGRTYLLDGVVFVEGDARLVIEPGVTVLGQPSGALIVTRDASIHARGTSDEPIVFTSANPEGSRSSGDWGGVVLLGNAPINRGRAHVERVPSDDPRGTFGGNDRRSNCGVLEYVRIEFAGYAIGTDNELNGLTLGGCGIDTLVRHVQVHRANDDAIEILGGTVDLKYIFASHPRDDAFDWDMGWTGRAQFLVVQHHPELGDNGFEGNNWTEAPDAKPISHPRIYNVTVVGSDTMDRIQRAMVIRRGSGGEFRNFLITGFPLDSIDLRGELTAARIASKALSFGSIVMSAVAPDDHAYFANESGAGDDDGGFDEGRYFSESAPDIVLGAPEALGPDAWNVTEPNFTPVAPYIGAGSQWSPPANEGFWDDGASYYGAVRYGEQANWMRGWTATPES